MRSIPLSIRTTTAVAFTTAHVFAAGFWAGSIWKEKSVDGTVVRNRNDALIYLLCTAGDTPQECAGKLASELKKEREAEKDWKIPDLRRPR